MAKYSANMVSDSFWFSEFSQYIQLLNEDIDFEEIKQKVVDENYFKQSTSERALYTYRQLSRRIETLNSDYIDLFSSLDIQNQKIINLLSIMKLDKLFSEFMYEVYRDEIILGDSKLYDYEIQAFFDRKQGESDQVASWTDETVLRLSGTYKTFLRESNLLKDNGEYDDVLRVFIDLRLEDIMRSNGENVALASLLGR